MDTNYFNYHGKRYNIGTIVKINENGKKYCGFNSTLKFTGYNISDDLYCFSSIYDMWKVYKLSNNQIGLYVDDILVECRCKVNDHKKSYAKYIDGIVSAWIWYIIIMFFALFLKGIENILLTWIVSTFIFFRWRHQKMNGG